MEILFPDFLQAHRQVQRCCSSFSETILVWRQVESLGWLVDKVCRVGRSGGSWRVVQSASVGEGISNVTWQLPEPRRTESSIFLSTVSVILAKSGLGCWTPLQSGSCFIRIVPGPWF